MCLGINYFRKRKVSLYIICTYYLILPHSTSSYLRYRYKYRYKYKYKYIRIGTSVQVQVPTLSTHLPKSSTTPSHREKSDKSKKKKGNTKLGPWSLLLYLFCVRQIFYMCVCIWIVRHCTAVTDLGLVMVIDGEWFLSLIVKKEVNKYCI